VKALQNLLPLLFVLTVPCLGRITSRLVLTHYARRYAQEVEKLEQGPVCDGEASSSSGSSSRSIGNIRNRRMLSSTFNPNNATGPDKPNVKRCVWWWLLAILFGMTWLSLGLLLSMWSTSHQFLVSKSRCGLTSLSDTATYAQYLLDQQHQAARERIAAEEVELCHTGHHTVDQALCKLLHVSVRQGRPCPFTSNPSLCHSSNSTTVLQTEWTSVRELGHNTNEDVVFQHTASCTPLDMTHPRLIAEPLDDVLKLSWLHSYYYGGIDGLFSTFQLISTVFDFRPRYATFAADVVSENRHARYDREWHADPGLHHDVNSSLTLIFADQPPDLRESLTLPSSNATSRYIESSSLPLPIACVEYQVFCNSDKTACFPTIKSDYPAGDFELISQLMQRSSLADAIRYSGGRAVLRESTMGSTSTVTNNTDDDDEEDHDPYFESQHWSRALERQFETSIAMLYNNMREFALGTGNKGEAYVRDDRLDPFCGSYKITLHSPRLWACRIWWWLLFATLPLLLFVLTRKWQLPAFALEGVPGSWTEKIDELGLLDDDVSYWFDDRCLVGYVLLVQPFVWLYGKAVRQCIQGRKEGGIQLPYDRL
jgi:hypothetical protein